MLYSVFLYLKKMVGRWYVPLYLQQYFGRQSQHQMSNCGRYFCSSIWFFTDLQMLLYWWFWSCFWVSYFGTQIVWLFCPLRSCFLLSFNTWDLDIRLHIKLFYNIKGIEEGIQSNALFIIHAEAFLSILFREMGHCAPGTFQKTGVCNY